MVGVESPGVVGVGAGRDVAGGAVGCVAGGPHLGAVEAGAAREHGGQPGQGHHHRGHGREHLHAAALLAPGHGGGDGGPVGRRQALVDGRLGGVGQVGDEALLEGVHQASTSRSWARARCRPDFTVPVGIWSTSAISSIDSWS